MASDSEPTRENSSAGNGLSARQRNQLQVAEKQALTEDRKRARRERRRARPRVKKLRMALVFSGLAVLAVVSWVFGVLMAVAQDLPNLESRAQYNQAENSIILDRDEGKLVTLTGNERRILVESDEIGIPLKDAVVAIEDQRFYSHRGIDYLGLARALREDIVAGGAVQGASTITQQFVKNALAAQSDRTILQKLRESALAYQLERQWPKDKILTNYLNNIYFGEGAYGIEAAARAYFGANHPGCGDRGNRCASQLRVDEAAMLAGMISSPGAYNPRTNAEAAVERRNLVLEKMRELGQLEVTDEEMEDLKSISPPGATQIEQPVEPSEAPYFTDWLRQQIVDRYGAGEAFGGGLEVTSTLDLEMQAAAQQVVDSRMSGLGPTAAAVVIENGTGKVRAMVGGSDFENSPFNLATNGLRQPGSSFKPFTLVTALSNGVGQNNVYPSAPKKIPFVNEVERKDGTVKKVDELFKVNNYEDNYLGSASLRSATTYSDNSVYAEVGTDLGPEKVARTAQELGIATDVGKNPAMILGGLETGVTPLEMAYAFSTLANGGKLISGTMASRGKGKGPVAIEEVRADGDPVKDDLGGSGKNEITEKQVLDQGVADEATEILRTVVTSGTGKRAQVGGDYVWGKTGTTDNNADAWFVGANETVTVAVWVGWADAATPMETEFGGQPVDGGTIPAEIFRGVVAAWDKLAAGREAAKEAAEAEKKAEKKAEKNGDSTSTTPATEGGAVEEAPAEEPQEEAPAKTKPPAQQQPPANSDGGSGNGDSGGGALGAGAGAAARRP
jgi:penicillin-binding protein 1A